MGKILQHPIFWLGLALRIGLIAGLLPSAVVQWYAPFLDNSLINLSFDPWTKWLLNDGSAAAFPYGYVMWISFLPASLAVKFAGVSIYYGYAATLIAADLGLMAVLLRLIPKRPRLLLFAYWLSPIALLGSFALALNDVIPALLLTLSMLCVRQIKLRTSGVLLAAAISAKLSVLVAVPFFLIYLYNNKPLRERFFDFVLGFALAAMCFGAPFLLSPGARTMLVSNPEITKIFNFQLLIGGEQTLQLVPFIYFMIMYLTWRIKRLNFELFVSMTGVAFLLIVLMTPASPGWFIWCLPFLVYYQSVSGYLSIVLVGVFSSVYVLSTLLNTPLQFASGKTLNIIDILPLDEIIIEQLPALLTTMMFTIGFVLVFRLYREGVSRNDYFRISRKPFVIGVAGDSGSGKDVFAEALLELFGAHSTTKLSGDDYHLWDRHKPMWQVLTHLNPMANDLERYSNDLQALVDGRTIVAHQYDHYTGKMTKPNYIKNNDFIIASGLHVLYLPALHDIFDLKIFLDIDEGLRRYFKIERDVKVRGHALDQVVSSIEKRVSDSVRFIKPQAASADLILSLQPIHPRLLNETHVRQPIRLKLVVRSSNIINEMKLSRVLVGICGLHLDIVNAVDSSEIELTIEGEVTAADIEVAASMLCPRSLEFLDIKPVWRNGMSGVMQLITLSQIDQNLKRRILS